MNGIYKREFQNWSYKHLTHKNADISLYFLLISIST